MKPEATRSIDQKLVNWREQRLVERLLTGCGLSGGTLLDAPCGYGRFWPLFSRLGIRSIGIDLDWKEVRMAAASTQGMQWDGARASIFQLPFGDGVFDCVFCTRFLHLAHSDGDRLRIFRELARVAGRYVIVSLYLSTPLHSAARRLNSTPGRVRIMDRRQLADLSGSSGLQVGSLHALIPGLHMQTFAVLEPVRVRPSGGSSEAG